MSNLDELKRYLRDEVAATTKKSKGKFYVARYAAAARAGMARARLALIQTARAGSALLAIRAGIYSTCTKCATAVRATQRGR